MKKSNKIIVFSLLILSLILLIYWAYKYFNSFKEGISNKIAAATPQPIYNNSTNPISLTAFDFNFSNLSHVEIPFSVHSKYKILHVQAYNLEGELIFPPIKVVNENTVIADFSSPQTGKIKIL